MDVFLFAFYGNLEFFRYIFDWSILAEQKIKFIRKYSIIQIAICTWLAYESKWRGEGHLV